MLLSAVIISTLCRRCKGKNKENRHIDENSIPAYNSSMINSLFRLKIAAERCKVKRTTLLSAIDRGEVPTENTGCGLPLVRLADVRKWAKKDRPVGRKPAARRAKG